MDYVQHQAKPFDRIEYEDIVLVDGAGRIHHFVPMERIVPGPKLEYRNEIDWWPIIAVVAAALAGIGMVYLLN